MTQASSAKFPESLLATGQTLCYDAGGLVIACSGSGQDGELRRGLPWPTPRFEVQGECVLDRLTDLMWTQRADLADFPLTWAEALEFVAQMRAERTFGFDDWRLPNRRELRSLMSYQTRRPALPEHHPFLNIFSGWYWTSSSAAIAPAHAWYVHMEGARMFYGGKDQSYMLWPVRGGTHRCLLATGQTHCYDSRGEIIACANTGQDGALQLGRPWPQPRFSLAQNVVLDGLTGLYWRVDADLSGAAVNWQAALDVAAKNNARSDTHSWRLPNINELESLVDCSQHQPALPAGHPFQNVRSGYWSSTSSAFEPDWAWALYLDKGACGVGQKSGAHFFVCLCA